MNLRPQPSESGSSPQSEIAGNLAAVQARIDAARQPDQDVTLVAVTKKFPLPVLLTAIEAGCSELGENYAQELEWKAAALPELLLSGGLSVQPEWHMIGPVQRNKVRRIANVVTLWHTVDRASLADEIAKRAPGAAVLLQVNFTGEESKSGADPDHVDSLFAHAANAGLLVKGLMTMGPTNTEVDPTPSFVACRAMADEMGLDVCSMGMSGDFEKAVGAGSTMVRIGSALLGPRPEDRRNT